MKKFLAVAAVLAISASLTACSGAKSDNSDTQATSTAADSVSEAVSDKAENSQAAEDESANINISEADNENVTQTSAKLVGLLMGRNYTLKYDNDGAIDVLIIHNDGAEADETLKFESVSEDYVMHFTAEDGTEYTLTPDPDANDTALLAKGDTVIDTLAFNDDTTATEENAAEENQDASVNE